jgi:hypothetical protein
VHLKLEKFLVLTLMVFLPSQLAAHWWPTWSLMSGVRIDYLSPTLYFTDLIILVLLVFGFFKKYLKIPKIFLLIFAVAIFNIYFSISPFVSLYWWFRFLELFMLGLYFYQRSQHLKSVIAGGLIVALVWTSVLAVWQFVTQGSINGLWYFLGERNFSLSTPGVAKLDLGAFGYWLRPYATLPHPNALAGFLLIGSLLVYYFGPKSGRWWLVLITGAIFLAWSRAVFAVALALIAFPLLALAFFLPGNPTSFSERSALAASTVAVFQEHWLTGIGLGNMPNFQPVHNIYLLVLSQTGIILFSVLLVYLIKVFVYLYRSQKWSLLKMLLIILGLGLVDHYWLTLHQTSILLTILISQVRLQSKTT